MDLFKTLFFVFVVFISKSTAMEAVTHDEEPHKKRTPEERVKAATKVVTQINSYLGQEHKSYSSPYRSIDDYCKHSKKTILIVGSGYAYFSLEKFINKSNDYYTIDINKETESSNLKWPNSFPDYVGDITSIDFSVFNVFKNKFDVIIFEGLTNHVLFGTYDDPKKITELLAIKNGLQMLLPEGKLIFNIPPLKVRLFKKEGVFYPEFEKSNSFEPFLVKIAMQEQYKNLWDSGIREVDWSTFEILKDDEELQHLIEVAHSVYQEGIKFLIKELFQQNFKSVNFSLELLRQEKESHITDWLRGFNEFQYVITCYPKS